MTRLNRVVVRMACAFATLFCVQAAQAQSTEPPPGGAVQQPAVEVTPFVGLGSPGSARAGAAVAFVLTPKVRLESEVAYHPRGLFSSSVNLRYSLPHVGAVEPYVTAGIGICQNESAVQAPVPGGFLIQRSEGLVVNAGTDSLCRCAKAWAIASTPGGRIPSASNRNHGASITAPRLASASSRQSSTVQPRRMTDVIQACSPWWALETRNCQLVRMAAGRTLRPPRSRSACATRPSPTGAP